jgi:formate hydrogenlyase subunit 6/NADH:ubiquinone oxidoreductase subunit I
MPGLSGLAQLLPALLLLLRGYKMVGLQPMDLPSNWISIHPGLRQKVVDSIFVRCERITKKFAEKILSGGKRFKGLLSSPVDLMISPISLAYYFLGRFALAKTFVAGSNCNGCSLCEKECPVHAIEMKNSRPFWTARCESCMHCMNRCPRRAIQTPHLFVMVLWWLVFLFIPMVILKNVLKFYPENETLYNLVFDVVTIITAFPIIFFSYRILHFLMKYRFFNWLVTFTSLTKLKFWRRYFAPKKYLS